MNQSPDHHTSQLEFLRDLVQENASIDLDVIEFGPSAWAIHGRFPYDGEVPMAVFDTYDEARQVLEQICGSAGPPNHE
jgi:hypothetical protein